MVWYASVKNGFDYAPGWDASTANDAISGYVAAMDKFRQVTGDSKPSKPSAPAPPQPKPSIPTPEPPRPRPMVKPAPIPEPVLAETDPVPNPTPLTHP